MANPTAAYQTTRLKFKFSLWYCRRDKEMTLLFDRNFQIEVVYELELLKQNERLCV
jgi:hypothetical protein